MKTKTFFLTTLVFVSLIIYSTGMQAQTVTSNLDQFKLMQQGLGTWQRDIGKDTVEVQEFQQYGKAFMTNVYYIIKGKKSPLYINNYSLDSKEGNFKGYAIWFNGDYGTWIGQWTTEKKFSADLVQNFKPETVNGKVELLFENPTKMTWTNLNTEGTKTGEFKFNKVK